MPLEEEEEEEEEEEDKGAGAAALVDVVAAVAAVAEEGSALSATATAPEDWIGSAALVGGGATTVSSEGATSPISAICDRPSPSAAISRASSASHAQSPTHWRRFG